jgi:hypothetical protein
VTTTCKNARYTNDLRVSSGYHPTTCGNIIEARAKEVLLPEN